MPAKVQSTKIYLLPGHQSCYAPLGIKVDPVKSHLIAQHWNYKDQPMMLSLGDDGITVEVKFLAPFKYSWLKRLFGIRPYLQFSVIELTDPPAPTQAPTNG